MLRLTLRTLLAYLDDTLEPAQTKQIGEKVAESDEAKKTIERIKTVTRRRRLTALPVDAPDPTTDPNTIAEYLDSTLPSDQLVEVEQAALDNDTMLAEVAACHQILTLVLGEPARVPTTARVRMYRLVKGPESLPYRKPTAETPVAGVAPPEDADENEDDLLGSVLGPQRVYWLLGCLLLMVLLIAAIWLALPITPATPKQGYVNLPVVPAPVPKVLPTPKIPEVVEKKPPTIPQPDLPEIGPEPRLVPPVLLPPTPKKPDEQRDACAVLFADSEPLFARKRDTTKWERVPTQAKLNSTDALLALPGMHPTFMTDTGVKVQLWGNMNEFLNVPIAATSITTYIPPRGIDAEFTLHFGRVFLSAPKATNPVVVRVRFLDEIWDITLPNNTTEVALDRLGVAPKLEPFALPESPRVVFYLGVVQGSASYRDGPHESGPLPEGTKIKFDNKGGRAGLAPKTDPDEAALVNRWAKVYPNTRDAKQMTDAVDALRLLVTNIAQPEVDFAEIAKDSKERRLSFRTLAVHASAALDNMATVLDATEYDHADVREAATTAALRWAVQSPDRPDKLADALGMKATYTEDQRAAIVGLVLAGNKPTADNVDKVFALLKNDKLAVREFAKAYLTQFDATGAKDHNYDASQPAEFRTPKVSHWLQTWKKREKQ